MNDPILTRAVTRYYSEKAKIKARQRAELETELEELAADVGDEIARVRLEKSASIADISAIMGVQNRTLIYQMIRSSEVRRANGAPAPKPDHLVEETTEDDAPAPAPQGEEYSIAWFNNGQVATVTFAEDESYDIVMVDGSPDLPDEWAEHSRERRVLYKEIAKKLREGEPDA